MNKIGALIYFTNHESTIVFSIASILPHVDYCVVVNICSTDKSTFLIKKMFNKELNYGHLTLIEDENIYDAIQLLKAEGCNNYILLNPTDVFYTNGAIHITNIGRNIGDEIAFYTTNYYEVFQDSYISTFAWLDGMLWDIIRIEYPNFLQIEHTNNSIKTGIYKIDDVGLEKEVYEENSYGFVSYKNALPCNKNKLIGNSLGGFSNHPDAMVLIPRIQELIV